MLNSYRPPRQRGPLLFAILLVLGACSSEPEPHNRVSISVAPLKLDDLTDVEYLLTVTNSEGGIVWTREVSSTRYGDGKGALTYIGPCDADANPNTVSVDILRLIGPDEEPVPATAWSNPSPVRQTITCQENADTAALFDITVLRDAEQGFFDIAVEFDDVFCSAKLDCQEDLLHRPDGERGPTAVVGFACASGNGQPTWLYFADDIKLTCGDRTYFIDPTAGPGNLGGDSPAVFQAATFRGREGFPNVDKCFWNTAIGIEPTSTPCTLSARATASSRPFVGGELPPNSVWPEIVWNNIPISGTDTLSCGTHPLGGDGSLVQTSYTRTGQAHFRHELECATGNVATLGSRVCVGEGTPCDLGDPCANGTCSAEGTCTLTSTQPDGQLCTLPGVCDPLGTCVSACAQGACEGARPASVLRSFAVEPETVLTDAVDDSNQHGYLAKGGEGVGVFDLGDPANPVALGTWTAADIDCTELALVRDAPSPVVAAACGQAGVKLIDFSDPGTPVLLATLATTAPATTLTAVGPWLYSGDGDTLNIHDLSNPSNPLAQSPVVIAEADPIVAVRSTPAHVYSLLASGSVIQSEVSAPGQITQRSVLPARANPTGLAVEHDFVFATFDGPGFYVYDFNGTTPVEIYHDGGSRILHLSVSGYRGVIVYSDQRVVTLSLRHYHRPKVLTSSVAPAASGVAVLDGLAFLAHGDTFDLLDYLPFVIGSSPVDDSAGLCGDATLELRFSEPIDADCVDNSSLDLTRGATSIAGLTDQRTPEALTFAPDVAIENGTYKARAQSICDLRDNPGPLVPDDVDFEVDTTCIASDFPNTALSGQPVRFTWTTAATPTSTTLFASTGPQGHSPYSDRFAIPGSPNVSGGHEATWVAPIVTTPTTYWVVASADIGATTRYGEVLPIVVEPDPLSCIDCVPPAATVLDTASRSAGAIRDALEDNDDPNLAYLAVGSDGLEVRDQSDPTNTQVVATWSEVNPDLDCQELVQVGDLLYIACGAAGVKCVSVADPSSPAFIDTLATGPATTIATYGDALYVGVGDRVAVYDIVDPLAPTFTGWLGGSSGQGPSPIVSVVVDGDLIYAFFGDGTLIVSHAATPTAPVYVRTIAPTAPGLTAADLQVVGGLGYLAYQGAGLYIVDLREVFTPGVFTPTTLWHDGGSDIVRVSVAGRTFAVLYADGTGLLANASIPTSPLTLSRSEITGAATGLALLPRWLYSGHGLTLRVVDVPPYVVGSSHRPDTRGVCGDVPLDTYFSAPLDPQTVTADTVSVDTAGSLATSGARVRFTPSTTFAVGDHTTRVTQKDIANSRGTLGPAPDYVSNFEISSLCLDWLAVPDSVLSGTPADLRWAVTGADSTRVHISSWPDPADPYAQTITASGSPDTGAFAATFEAPAVTTPTTFYAVAEARVGDQSYWGPVTTFEVTPALATAQTFANATILDAVDHGDLAYAANGTGLEIHDVSNPASPAVVGFWVDPRGGTCSAIAIDSPYVYLACGASGVYVLDVTTTTPSLAFWIEQPASTLSLYGSTLYIGQGEDIAVWNVGNPTAPLFVRTLDTGANSQLVRVVTQDGVLYAFYANGTLYIADVADAQNPAFVRLLPSLHPGKAGLDLRIVNGVIYLGYRDIGLVAVDAFDILSPTWTPSTLWTLPAPDANSHIVRFDVRDGLVTVVYSNGRFYVGALSSSPGQPPTELVSTLRSGTPSAVTLLASGYVLGAWGNTFSYVDPPLWLLFSSPAAGSSSCGDTEVTLVFSAPVRAASLTDRALRIVRSGSPVEGTFTANGAVVRFVPSAPLAAGLHTVEILAPLENVRGTQASPTSFTFTAGGGCIELTSAPSRVVAGSGARFAWQTTGGTASNERLLIATSPLSAPQYQLSATSPATFATPSVATPTTLYAQVEATVGGATTRSAPTAFVVEPPLSTLSAADNETLSAVAEGDDGLAYLATGIGLSIRDVSNPDQPFELGRWSRADLSTCDTIAIRQSGEPNAQGRRATVVYLGCGADGVLVLDVSDPLSPVYATTLVVDAVSLVTVGDALHLGLADGSVRIYDLTLGLAPVYRTTLTGPGPSLVRVFVDGLVLYVLYADGTVGRYDVSDLFAPTGLTTISAYLSGTAVDFTVVDGIAYVAYSNGQITIIDVRGPTLIGTVLPPPGAGALVGVSYRNGILACVYAGGGFATVNVIDPAHPVLIGYTAGSETPTLVYIFRSGYAFWSTGTSIQIVDLPPVLTHTFPDGASGCPTAPMYLRFSQQLEASSINSSTVRATRDGLPVSFVRSLDPTTLDTLILTPQGPLSGTVVVTIQGVSNRRGTTMVQAETRTFTYASVCLTWQSAPVGTASGLTSNLSFASSQAVTSPELLIGPLDAPSSTWTAYPATTAGVTHTVAFTAPTVSTPTRYGAVPRVTVNGSPTVGGFIHFVILPEPCALTPQCDDGNACTDEQCTPYVGCVVVPDDTNGCDDDNACTSGDYCQAGACRAASTTTCTAATCEVSSCDAQTGQCVTAVASDGALCDDSDPGTSASVCQAGTCEAVPEGTTLTTITVTQTPTQVIRRMVQVGVYGYAVLEPGGLVILNLSNPSSPVPVGSWSVPGRDACVDVTVVEGRAYLLCSGELFTLDVSSPTQPVFVDSTPVTGASTIVYEGGTLYIGTPSGLVVYQLGINGRPTLSGTIVFGDGPLVRVWYQDGLLYTASASGIVRVFDASGGSLTTRYVWDTTTWVDGTWTVTDFVVIGGYLYLSYAGGGVYAFDTSSPNVPSLAWWTGPGNVTSLGYANGLLVYGYANGGFVTASVVDPSHPISLAWTFESGPISAATVIVSPSGEAVPFSASGPSISTHDVPPYVAAITPSPGSTGLCAQGQVVLWFSTTLDPSSVTATSVIVETLDGSPIPGTRVVDNHRVTFTPTAPFAAGDYRVRVTDQLENVRSTPFSAEGYSSTFSVALACVQWTAAPSGIVKGLTGTFSFNVVGATPTTTELLFTTHPDVNAPIANPTAVLATPDGPGYSAAWTAPVLARNTTYYATPRVTLGASAILGPTVAFLVVAEGCFCSAGERCESGLCVPEPECDPGYGNCDAYNTNGCETPIDVDDVNHCGGCHVRCGGGVCEDGECLPTTLVSAAGSEVFGVDVDNTHIYWAARSSQQLRRSLKDGTGEELLASGYYVTDVAVDDTYVYFTTYTSQTLHRVPKGGGAVTLLAHSQPFPIGLAKRGHDLYYTSGSNGGLRRLSLLNGTTSQVAAMPDSHLGGLAIEGDSFFSVGSAGAVYQTDTTTEILASPGSGLSLADADTRYVYFGGSSRLGRVNRETGVIETFSTSGNTYGVAVDDRFIYWTNATSATINRIAKPLETDLGTNLLCRTDHANCNDDPADDCETDIDNDPDHCGACGNSCGTGEVCVAGTCGPIQCPPGFDDCDGDPDNGCEVDLVRDADHCGACNNGCDSGFCRDLQCVPDVVSHSCLGHQNLGLTSSGHYLVDPDGNGPAPTSAVYCDQDTDGGGWMVVARASDTNGYPGDYEFRAAAGARSLLDVDSTVGTSDAAQFGIALDDLWADSATPLALQAYCYDSRLPSSTSYWARVLSLDYAPLATALDTTNPQAAFTNLKAINQDGDTTDYGRLDLMARGTVGYSACGNGSAGQVGVKLSCQQGQQPMFPPGVWMLTDYNQPQYTEVTSCGPVGGNALPYYRGEIRLREHPCTDGFANADETDVDCGGPVCARCTTNDICLVASDCDSRVCTGGICRAPTCSDFVQNGTETGIDCGGSCGTLCNGVTWQNPVGVVEVYTAEGAGLDRTTPGSGWDAGASSVQTVAGNGFVSFVATEVNRYRMIGLSNGDTDAGYGDIDFAWYLHTGNGLYIYEQGSQIGSFGSYATGDTFRVEVFDNQVRYVHNGVVRHTSTRTPTFPLRVDTSLYDQGATLRGVLLTSCATIPDDPICVFGQTWRSTANISGDGDSLVRSNTAQGWTSGASSADYFTCGYGAMTVTATERTTERVAGLGDLDSSVSNTDVDYGIHFRADGTLGVLENGTIRGSFGTYQTGDVFRVEMALPTVTYKKNGAVFYSSTVPASELGTWVLDTAFYTPNATLDGLQLIDLSPTGDPTCGGAALWKNYNSVVRGNGAKKATGAVTWDQGASTVEAITSGDGFAEMTVAESNTSMMVGLGDLDNTRSYTDIDFATYLSATTIYVYESGSSRGTFGNYKSGDRMRVEVDNGQVLYRRNGVHYYTSSLLPIYPLALDISFYSVDATVNDVDVHTCGVDDALCNPTHDWRNGNYLSSEGLSLWRDIGGNSWNSGAATQKTITCGQGRVSAVVANITDAAFGLGSVDTNQSHTDIEYAFMLVSNGQLLIYESGTQVAVVGNYTLGDELTVEIDIEAAGGPVVQYLQNDVLVYTSNRAPMLIENFQLDTAFFRANSRFDGLVITDDDGGLDPACGGSSFWANPVNVATRGTSLRREDGGNNYQAGAVSQASFTGDGYMEFTVPTNTYTLAVGLSSTNVNTDYTDLEYGIYFAGSTLYIYESGSSPGSFGTFEPGGRFRIESIGGKVRYLRDGVIFHTSSVAPTGPLFVDTSMYSNLSTATDFVITACTPEDESCARPIDWYNGRYLRAFDEGRTLRADPGANGWVAGAATTGFITCGHGSVSAIATETNKDRVFGLGIGNTNVSYSDIEYGLYLTSSGTLQVTESGTTRGTFGTYSTGDVLSVEVDVPTVVYKKNGATLYTSTVPASVGEDYRLDTSFYSGNSSLAGLTVNDLESTDPTCGASAFWTEVVNAVPKSNNLRKDYTVAGYNAGAVSVQTLSGDGFAEFTIPDTAYTLAVGLSNGNTDAYYNDIDFNIYFAGSGLHIYEGTTHRGSFSDYPSGSRFRVEVVDGVVRYLRNGVGMYKSLLNPTFPLNLDTSLYSEGARVRDVVIADCDGSCAPAIRWQNGRRVSAPVNSTLVRDDGNSWTAGASSEGTLNCGRGLARTVVTENNTERMFGLGINDSTPSYSDIDYAFYLVPNGALSVYESGVLRGNFGTYAPGDVLEVEVDQTVVRYKKNGTTVYTSGVTADPVEGYRLDTALYTAGSRLTGLELVDVDAATESTCGGAALWQSLTAASIKGTSLRKTGTTGWNSGAVTANSFVGDGYVTFKAGETSSQVAAGLGTASVANDLYTIPFAVGLIGGTVQIYETGTFRGSFGSYQIGDAFRVERIGSTIRYLRNGVGLYTSTLTSNPADALRGQVALYTTNASVRALSINSCSGDDSCTPALRWQNGRGVSGDETSLRRDATGSDWASGAISEQAIDCQEGSVETTITSLTGQRVFGLGRGDDHRSYSDIDYGYWIQNNTLTIYENGNSRGTFGTLALGDILEVDVSGTTVGYYRTPPGGSRTIIYTSTEAVSPLDTLRLDTSFGELNSGLSELYLDDLGETDPTCGGAAFWKSQNTTVKWNHIIKDSGVNGLWDRGASTQAQITSGDGYLEFTPGETNTTRIIGLGRSDDNDTQADIDFAIQLNNNAQAVVLESGTQKATLGAYSASDRFSIRVLNGQVTYLKNGFVLYNSLLAPVYPLEGDVSLYTSNSRIMDVDLVVIDPGLCGNGNIDIGETCDDGDNSPGDGCAANCQIEPNYACIGTPSVCTPYGVLRSCRAHLVAGSTTSGVYTIDPDGGGPNPSFQVWCDQTTDGGGWTVFQRRVSASDFYRFYADYAAGFGDPATNYWMGNNRLADFTTRFASELRVDFTYSSTAYHAKYTSFAISGAADGYRLAVSGYSGNAGDSLGPQNNYRFTTRDVDQDGSGGNCANDYLSAWWYTSCHSSNLNGVWGSTAYGQGLNWYSVTGYYASATLTEMKVREPIGDLGCDGVSGSGRTIDACGVCGDGSSCGAPALPTSGLTTWLRAHDLSAQASGTPVASWSAAPGTSITATQATTTRQPQFIPSGPNGKPTVRFDGGDRLDLSTNTVAAHPRTIFAVVSTTTSNAHLIGTGSSSAGFLTTYGSGLMLSSGRPAAKANNNSSGILMTAATAINDGNPRVVSAVVATGSGQLLVGADVVATSTATANPWAYTRATLGASDGSATNAVIDPLTGDISEVLIYDRTLSASEQEAVRNYLTAKYIPANKLLDMQFEGSFASTGSLTVGTVGSPTLQSGGGAKSDGFANGFVLGSSYLDIEDIYVGGTGSHTFSAWYRGTQSNAVGNVWQPGVVIFGDPANSVYLGLGIDGGRISVAHAGQYRGTRRVDDGQWHHLAWVRRGNTWSGYVDGVLDLASATTLDGTSFHYIRAVGTGYPYANVVGPTALDRLAIFDRALTEAEIRILARTAIFESTGAAQTFVVPTGVSAIDTKVWGAGGSGAVINGGGLGGGGAFVLSTLFVIPGELLTLVVGSGGGLKSQDTMHGGGGGGLSGLFRAGYSQANALVVAGGGGGAVHCASGGAGGGPGGTAGQTCYSYTGFGGGGGTQSAGGAAGSHITNTAPMAGSALLGGNGGDPEHSGTSPAAYGGGASGGIGGGGGGGFFGGGGGGHHSAVTGGGGGGGASFSLDTSALFGAGSAATPGGTNDADYNGTAGRGGSGPEAGRPGRVIIRW